jgi:nucleotide-binding universal stress UspA family protein
MIIKINKILFITDLSKGSRYAYNYVVNIASWSGASIVIFHVIEELPKNVAATNIIGEKQMEEINKKKEFDTRKILIGKKKETALTRKSLERFFEDAGADIISHDFMNDEIIVKKGENVATEVIRQAEASNCDLIVMAYRSLNMFAEAMTGGKSRKILRRSKKPVLLVPVPDE